MIHRLQLCVIRKLPHGLLVGCDFKAVRLLTVMAVAGVIAQHRVSIGQPPAVLRIPAQVFPFYLTLSRADADSPAVMVATKKTGRGLSER